MTDKNTEPEIRIVSVPSVVLGPAIERTRKYQEHARNQIADLVSPETLDKLDDIEREADRRLIEGE